jgi:ADP-ribose pyrophosphatase YjhB (NUDIX family)
MIDHYLQQDIINKLSRAETCRFSELKPKELESNLFMYHLKQLITAGYVKKVPSGYQLGAAGLTYVDMLSRTNSKPRKQPKLVSILAVRNSEGEYLLARRLLQPYIDKHMFLSGKQHFGESAEDHIKRELAEQTSLLLAPKRRGLADIRIKADGQLLTHIVAHIYSFDYDGPPPPDSDKFTYSWQAVAGQPQVVAGTIALYERLEREKELFFIDLAIDENER